MIDADRARITLEIAGIRARSAVYTVVQLAALAVVAYGGWGILQYVSAIPAQPAVDSIPTLSPDPVTHNGFIMLAGLIVALATLR